MSARIDDVKISDCLDQKTPICSLKRNSTPDISIEFTYSSGDIPIWSTTGIDSTAHSFPAVAARKANVTVNAVLLESIVAPPTMFDACAHGVLCPILQGKKNVFKAPIPVRTQYIPPFEVAFSYKMRDGNGPLILCMHVLVTVGDPWQVTTSPAAVDNDDDK